MTVRRALVLVVLGIALVLGVGVGAGVASPRRAADLELGPEVILAARSEPGDDEFVMPAEPIHSLTGPTVLRVRISGFGSFASGVVQRCVGVALASCRGTFPVQFDDIGAAFVQHAVADDFVGGCRVSAVPCFLVVRELDGDGIASRRLIFGSSARALGTVAVTPDRGVEDGDVLHVVAAGLPPNTDASITLCHAPDVIGIERCGAPGLVERVQVGPDGTIAGALRVRVGPVGREAVECGRGRSCAVAVLIEGSAVVAPVVPIGFAAPPGATYDTARLVVGLLVALGCGVGIFWLLRRTDWSPVGEAASPEIDNAEYPDLDAIIAALPPEPMES